MQTEEEFCRSTYRETVAKGGVTDREMELAWVLYSIERTGSAERRPIQAAAAGQCAPIYIDLARNILRDAGNRSVILRHLNATEITP